MARSSDDSDSEEDFVVLGTPVPDWDEPEVTKKPTTVQDLTAKDKEGRRRFHGAFTGGYSAGYFNTVGSKEGFTPSTFVSSRSQKHDDGHQSARPEDFMDDEDLEEHGIAPRKFATAGNFSSEERKRKLETVASRLAESSALDLGTAVTDLVIPEYLPMGIKLLRKMGWREGQGLGPRVKKKQKKAKSKQQGGVPDGKKVYGCSRPPSDSGSDDSDSFVPSNLSDVTFAPSDVTPLVLNAKDDIKGLGYRGLDPTLALPGSHVNLFADPVRGKTARGKGIRGHAFGVGALEDEDDDVYGQDSLSNYDVTMWEEGDEGKGHDGNFGWTAPRSHGKQTVPVSYVGKLLKGFCLSSKPLQPRKNFPPPKLPLNFKPFHWSRRRKKEEDESSGGQNKLSAIDRGLMLGETPIMNSVFDLVAPKDKSRMEFAKEAIEMTKSLSTSSETPGVCGIGETKEKIASHPSDQLDPEKSHQSKFLSRFTEATEVDTNIGGKDDGTSGNKEKSQPLFKGSLSLKPFRKDPAKQSRFDQYLSCVQQKMPDPYSQVSSSRMTEWEKARERDEFSRSARLFRPMSAMMSARFVEGAMLDDHNQDSKMETGDQVSDEMKASEMRMFGKLTREEFEWHPDKLLCKRFNVPNPYPGSDIVGLPTVKRDKYSIFNLLSIGDYRPPEPDTQDKEVTRQLDTGPKAESLVRPDKKKATLSSIFKVLDDPDFHRPPANIKPEGSLEVSTEQREKSMEEAEEEEEKEEEADVDLFRAIFKNSDSDESEDDEKSDAKESDKSTSDEDDKNDDDKDTIHGDNKMHSVIFERHSNVTADPIVKEHHSEMDKSKSSEGGLKSSFDLQMPELGSGPGSHVLAASVGGTPGKTVRSVSRWDDGRTKSVFSVLDEINAETLAVHKAKETEDDISDSEYGPALPPPTQHFIATSQSSNTAKGISHWKEEQEKCKEKEKHGSRLSHRDKHRHKKEKKKKSKHKSKKEKKHKKSKKSSKSRKSKAESSGSEADTETSDDDGQASDVSDQDLLQRYLQVSKKKSGKS